ncbi:MAG TPA: hypothetical protein VH170_00680 [Chthoniobacterales bacterium]|jgi:hypothetical protein|nr:hypothetical protein [Chthoniobacterales bacterium]
MSAAINLSRRDKMLVHCAPLREEHVDDRSLRTAMHHARKTEVLATQQEFDKAAAALVQAIPIPKEILEWVPTETYIAPPRRSWKKYAQNPAFLATGIAVMVIAIVGIFQLVERLNRFPGQSTALRLLTTAGSNKSMMLDPVKTDAGALGDYLFMKHRLVHYDVPPEFAELKILGCRVFDDEEGQRIAQIWAVEKKMQFFMFPAVRDVKTGKAKEFSGWRYVDQDRWTGVVKEDNGVCFMAAVRGSEKDLAPYVSKKKE